MYKVLFTGRLNMPRLLLEDNFTRLDDAERVAKLAAAAILPNYYWFGIYNERDELVKEVGFTPTVIYG
jgi:hypothetical protein